MSGVSEGRVRGMITRAVTGPANDAPKMQTIQVELYANETPDDLEHFQPFGFTSVPHPGAEGIALAVGGSRGHTVLINVDDRRYRLKGLQGGEVALYDDLGHTIHLTRNGIVIDGGGHQVTMRNLEKLRVEASIEATGEIKDKCDEPGSRSMNQMRESHIDHTHNENGVGAETDPPTQPL